MKKKKTYALQFQRMLKCCKVDGRIHGENKRLGKEENVWNANDRINIHSFFFFFKNASLIIPAHFFHINNGVFIFIEVEKISIH